MSIEEEVLKTYRPDESKLVPAGFVKDKDKYTYSEVFMNGDLRAEITVSKDGKVTGKVIDIASGDEYFPIRASSFVGSYVGEAREAYSDLLRRIAGKCFIKELFAFPQTNRIAKAIFEKYGEAPDCPFKKAEGYNVFRCAQTKKWYALTANIPRHLVTGEKPEDPENAPRADIMNVKASPERYDELMRTPAVFPGYHMDHKNWISVVLDGTLPDGFILELIAESRNFAAAGKTSRREDAVSWIVPANPAYYDIEEGFGKQKEIMWKQSRAVREGDSVYLYVASPVSQIRYKCVAVKTDIPFSYKDENVKMTRVMKLRLVSRVPEGALTVKKLRELGVKMLRGPVMLDRSLAETIAKAAESK